MAENLNLDVLVVDDSETMRLHLSSMLSENGCRVKEATDGREALEILKAYQPDLIINDFSMPGMDGFEMLRLLQGDPNLKDIPVFILTGKTMDSSTREMVQMESNVRDVFTKPPNLMLMFEALKELAVSKGKLPQAAASSGDPSKAGFEPKFRNLEIERFGSQPLPKPSPKPPPEDPPEEPITNA